MIIDAHMHLPVAYQRGAFEQSRQLLLDDMKKDGVDFAILIPDNVPGSAIGDVPACLRLVKDTPRLFLMGTIDVQTQGEEWVKELEGMISRRLLVAMKIFPGHDPVYPTDPRLDPVYSLCQAHNAPLVIHTGWNSGHPEAARYNDPEYIARVAERYPELRIVVSHLFWPRVDYCYERLHALPHVSFDTSALADPEVVEATGSERIRSVLMKLLREDPKKVIFGTDYAQCDRKKHIALVNHLPVSEEVQERVFWRNAAELFGLQDQLR